MPSSSPGEVSYGRRLTEIADERPDDVDLVIVDQQGNEDAVSWGRLESRANQIARTLAELGVQKDDVVALALPSCADHVLVTCAIWKLGASLLPLRHDMPQWEIDRLMQVAKPKVTVSDMHEAAGPVLTSADLAGSLSESTDPLPDAISECVNLIASSGSTGTPKLIMWPSRGVVSGDPQSAALAAADGVEARTLVTSPLYHVNGFKFAAPRILEGTSVVVMERFDAALAVDLIERKQITSTVMVPTMLQRIAQLDDLRAESFASIQRLIYGGAKVPEWVVDKWLELIEPERFMFTYGSSEGLGLCVMTGADWPTHRGSTGRPINVELRILDADGSEVPSGTVGEIHLRPPADQRVYEYIGVDTPAPTEDGFHTIGDLGYVDDDGFLYIADRRTDMIVTGGANVFPAEVETALSEHPLVMDQVVVGIADHEWGHRVHAIVQPADQSQPPTPEELRAWCKDRLASYKVPKTYEILAQIPRTEAGKLNRTRLGAERGDST
jgi:bile acid-coenzyme A ligase